jgi:hypothetical protein
MRLVRAAPFGVGLFLFLLPLAYPLGVGRDYPNHLARVYIQSHIGSDAALASNYALEWLLVPDLALDLFGIPLGAVISPYAVGGLFNGLMLLLLFTATLVLHRRRGGKDTVWPLLVTAVLFNEALRWGFVNFLFACGMALWIVYFWLESEEWHPGRRVAAFSLAQVGLFFAHLLGFMLCGHLILVLEVVRFWQTRDRPLWRRCRSLVLSMLQFAVPLAMFGYVLLGQSGVGDDTTLYGTIGAKALAFLSPTSALIPSTSIVVLLALLLLLYAVLRHRLADIDLQLLPLPIAMGGLCIIMPSMVLGIWGLDFRYPFVALLLAIAAVRLRPEVRGTGAVRIIVLGVTMVALFSAAAQFSDTDRKQQELRRAVALAAPGGALLVAGDYRPECPTCFPTWINQLHAGALAAIEQQMFVPLLFTATSLVAAAPDRHDLDVPHGVPVSRQALIEGRGRPLPQRGRTHDPRHPYWHSWDENFDYLLWMREGDRTLDDIPGLERLATGEIFVFYRILKPSQGGSP